MVGTGGAKLRVFSTEDGTPIATLPVGGPEFAPPISVGDDVVAASWGRRISVFRTSTPSPCHPSGGESHRRAAPMASG